MKTHSTTPYTHVAICTTKMAALHSTPERKTRPASTNAPKRVSREPCLKEIIADIKLDLFATAESVNPMTYYHRIMISLDYLSILLTTKQLTALRDTFIDTMGCFNAAMESMPDVDEYVSYFQSYRHLHESFLENILLIELAVLNGHRTVELAFG